jgi:hypothetical protein
LANSSFLALRFSSSSLFMVVGRTKHNKGLPSVFFQIQLDLFQIRRDDCGRRTATHFSTDGRTVTPPTEINYCPARPMCAVERMKIVDFNASSARSPSTPASRCSWEQHTTHFITYTHSSRLNCCCFCFHYLMAKTTTSTTVS